MTGERKIVAVRYNFCTTSGQYDEARVGVDGVKEIGEHRPQGPGDVWIYQVIKDNGESMLVFNMSQVLFGAPSGLEVPEKPKIIV